MKTITIDGVDYQLTPIKNEKALYYFISDSGTIHHSYVDEYRPSYVFRKKAGNTFATKDMAERVLEVINNRDTNIPSIV